MIYLTIACIFLLIGISMAVLTDWRLFGKVLAWHERITKKPINSCFVRY